MRNNHRRDEKNGTKHALGLRLFARLGLLCVLNASLLCSGFAQRPSGRLAAKPNQPDDEQVEREDPTVRHEQSPEVKAFRKKAVTVTFPSGGLTLKGWLYKPDGDGPFPAIIWNHGSEQKPVLHPDLGYFYVTHGYVLFLPVRHGHNPSPGDYIGDVIDRYKAAGHSKEEVQKYFVEQQEIYNKDVTAAVEWLKQQPFVDRNRMAVTGVSYGGIQTLLTAQKGLGLRAAVPFAPGAMSWGNPRLQQREIEAVRRSQMPLFLLQAQNDYSLGPSDVLGPVIRGKGGLNRAKVYPAFGTTHEEGHGGFGTWQQATAIWGADVLEFLRAAGVGPNSTGYGNIRGVQVLASASQLTEQTSLRAAETNLRPEFYASTPGGVAPGQRIFGPESATHRRPRRSAKAGQRPLTFRSRREPIPLRESRKFAARLWN
ncbi:MAG: hypothetical protein DMF67_17265 [Acidobacteria bacterium]|nr:MAG: hypothetical protein DMF67_17265 [Acidobacteriota bacterium]